MRLSAADARRAVWRFAHKCDLCERIQDSEEPFDPAPRTVAPMPVPLFDTETPLDPLRERIIERVAEVIRGGRFILGPEVRAFETELAAYIGVPHAIGVANGTDAISIAARALEIGPGDEVVLPSFTFYATAEAIATIGAQPV